MRSSPAEGATKILKALSRKNLAAFKEAGVATPGIREAISRQFLLTRAKLVRLALLYPGADAQGLLSRLEELKQRERRRKEMEQLLRKD